MSVTGDAKKKWEMWIVLVCKESAWVACDQKRNQSHVKVYIGADGLGTGQGFVLEEDL